MIIDFNRIAMRITLLLCYVGRSPYAVMEMVRDKQAGGNSITRQKTIPLLKSDHILL